MLSKKYVVGDPSIMFEDFNEVINLLEASGWRSAVRQPVAEMYDEFCGGDCLTYGSRPHTYGVYSKFASTSGRATETTIHKLLRHKVISKKFRVFGWECVIRLKRIK